MLSGHSPRFRTSPSVTKGWKDRATLAQIRDRMYADMIREAKQKQQMDTKRVH